VARLRYEEGFAGALEIEGADLLAFALNGGSSFGSRCRRGISAFWHPAGSRWHPDPVTQDTNALDLQLDDVTRLEQLPDFHAAAEAYRAGTNQFTGLYALSLRDISNDLLHLPHHLELVPRDHSSIEHGKAFVYPCSIPARFIFILPVLKLGIHSEMERPAILNRSIPCTAAAGRSVLPLYTKSPVRPVGDFLQAFCGQRC
jgi:hypothetical protein